MTPFSRRVNEAEGFLVNTTNADIAAEAVGSDVIPRTASNPFSCSTRQGLWPPISPTVRRDRSTRPSRCSRSFAGTPGPWPSFRSLEERQTRLKSELVSLRPSLAGRSPDLESVLVEQIRLAKGVLAQHRERLSTLQRLSAQGAATRGEVAEARGLLAQAEGDVNRARIELAEEKRRASSPGDWQITSSQDRLRAELDVIAYQRSQLLQAAGYPGRVTDVYAAEGEFVTVGAKLMQIGLLTDPRS